MEFLMTVKHRQVFAPFVGLARPIDRAVETGFTEAVFRDAVGLRRTNITVVFVGLPKPVRRDQGEIAKPRLAPAQTRGLSREQPQAQRQFDDRDNPDAGGKANHIRIPAANFATCTLASAGTIRTILRHRITSRPR
jgi:hypothetical protein